MRINNTENINKVTLIYKGKMLVFECFITPRPYVESFDLTETKPADIVFDDLVEVDALIDMLKKFKQETQERIGFWKETWVAVKEEPNE